MANKINDPIQPDDAQDNDADHQTKSNPLNDSAENHGLKEKWRLVLGRYAEELDANLNDTQCQQDQVLERLYQHGMEERGFKLTGSLDASSPYVVDWLNKTEELFPKSTSELLRSDAVDRFGFDHLLKHKEMLNNATPNMGLLKQLMRINAQNDEGIRAQVERIIRAVVDEMLKQLRPIFTNAISGRLNRHSHSPTKRLANLDWQRTIRKNLKHFDGEKVNFEHVYFYSRSQMQIPWHVILCIDQSGSMSESIIYSAVIAGILNQLPSVKLTLVVFDTQVVDLSEHASDPVKVLLSCQLGGGTLIANAWDYCYQQVTQPSHTVIATVSDFEEGGPSTVFYSQAKAIMDSGVKMIGMTAMTSQSIPFYDTNATNQLSKLGMDIAALSPDKFANWLATTMGLRR